LSFQADPAQFRRVFDLLMVVISEGLFEIRKKNTAQQGFHSFLIVFFYASECRSVCLSFPTFLSRALNSKTTKGNFKRLGTVVEGIEKKSSAQEP